MKNALRFTLGMIVLFLCAPAIFLIGLAIKLSSPGPVFFHQRRHGFDGSELRYWKFRTLSIAAEDSKRSRITPIGAFLRRTSLDELPILLQFTFGSLSLDQVRLYRPSIEKDSASTSTSERARRVLDAVSACVPKRLADEEIGDALELITRMETEGRSKFLCWTKVATTVFWVAVNALREIRRSWKGKK